MTTYVGGLRARLVKESVFSTIHDSLHALGWFDSGRRHAPINLVAEAQYLEAEIPPNTIAVVDEGDNSNYNELGSIFSEFTWTYLIDVFAESDSLGVHIAHDLKDILEGRMPSIGRTGPAIQVWDTTMATPLAIFHVEIETVRIQRAHNFPQPYLRHWYSLSFDLTDNYTNTDQGAEVLP